MAEIKPFRGVRFTPKAGEMDELLCPPYDIINGLQRAEYLEKNGNNIVKVELPGDEEGVDDKYAKAAEVLKGWMADGVMARDEKPALYIYEEQYTLHGETKSVLGIIGLVKLEEFDKGIIMPHEFTLSKPLFAEFRQGQPHHLQDQYADRTQARHGSHRGKMCSPFVGGG